jgi:hypothetical protein
MFIRNKKATNQLQRKEMIDTRVYNRGDMANPPHWATIIAENTTEWSHNFTLLVDGAEADALAGRKNGELYQIRSAQVSHTDSGNGSTRFVTEAAYNARVELETARNRDEAERRAARRS